MHSPHPVKGRGPRNSPCEWPTARLSARDGDPRYNSKKTPGAGGRLVGSLDLLFDAGRAGGEGRRLSEEALRQGQAFSEDASALLRGTLSRLPMVRQLREEVCPPPPPPFENP